MAFDYFRNFCKKRSKILNLFDLSTVELDTEMFNEENHVVFE